MRRSFLQSSIVLLVTILTFPALSAQAEVTRREANQLGVDVLTLKIGGDVRGVLLNRTDTELQIAVRREWLAKHQSDLLNSLPANGADAERLRVLVERIDAWLDDLGAGTRPAYSPVPKGPEDDPGATPDAELLRVLKAERNVYQEYLDDPLKMPPGEGTTKARQQAYRQLVAKLDTWVAEIEGGAAEQGESTEQRAAQNRDELIRILKSERDEYTRQIGDDEPADSSEFVRLTLSRADVDLIFAQSDARRHLAVAAFQQGVADVETASVPELQTRLEEAGVDWKDATADASALVDGAVSQDDREWAARRAVYEYQFLGRLDFQGTGNFVVQTGDDAPPPNMADLIQGVMDQQMSLALGDLLEEPIFTGLDFGGLGGNKNAESWQDKAIRTAEKQGMRGFRVTRMTPDVQRRQTLVEDRFFAKMPDGQWETVWSTQTTKSAGDANAGDLDRIKQDPQLKQVLGLAENLGLAGGNLDLALQFGAATMNAQQATDDEFYEFRDRYSQRLDGPPLTWE